MQSAAGPLDLRLWTLDFGLWTPDLGLWTLDPGLWTLDLGLWTLDLGLWTLDFGRLFPKLQNPKFVRLMETPGPKSGTPGEKGLMGAITSIKVDAPALARRRLGFR